MAKNNNIIPCSKRRLIRRLYMTLSMEKQNKITAQRMRGWLQIDEPETAKHKLKKLINEHDQTCRFIEDTIKLLDAVE